MDELKSLVWMVSKNKVKNNEIFGRSDTLKKNKQYALFNAIVKNRIYTDEDARLLLYPDDPKGFEKVRRLKKKLEKRLLDSLLHIDLNQQIFSPIRKVYIQCHKDYIIMLALIFNDEMERGIKTGEKALKVALQYEFTDLAVNFLIYLKRQYYFYARDEKKRNRCGRLLAAQMKILQAEIMAEEYFQEVTMQYINSLSFEKEMAGKAMKYAAHLKKLLPEVSSQTFILKAYKVLMLPYEINYDYKKVLAICDEALELLRAKKPHTIPNYVRVFLVKKTFAWLKLGNLHKSRQVLGEIFEMTEEKSLNWYILKSLHIKILFHAKEYQRAFQMFRQTVEPSINKKLPDNCVEEWKVLRAYLHYFIAAGKIDPGADPNGKWSKFRFSKFRNEVPGFTKDKRGGNIHVLILKLLFSIINKKYDEIADQLESLKTYSSRYLRKEGTRRSYYFIHMLMQLPRGYFNKKVVVRKAEKYVDRLRKAPLPLADQSAELEIVPFEHLWESVLELL